MTQINRRTFLAAGAAISTLSLSGCVSDSLGSFNEENEENTYVEINDIRVQPTPDGYNQNSEYFAVVSDNLQQEYEIDRHQQLRLRIQADGEAQWRLRPSIFTTKVEPDFTSEEDDTIWLSQSGMERIFASPDMIIAAQPFATSPLIETKEQARETDEFIEQSITQDGQLLACASGGGDIFTNTGLQALHVSSESDASAWACFGYDDRNRAKERFYVKPEFINPTSYNDVRFLLDDESFDNAVNFIGLSSEQSQTIVIGGLAQQSLQEQLRTNILTKFEPTNISPTIIIAENSTLAATDTQNIINRFTEGNNSGIQIAQSYDIYNGFWKEVAEGVLDTFFENDER